MFSSPFLHRYCLVGVPVRPGDVDWTAISMQSALPALWQQPTRVKYK